MEIIIYCQKNIEIFDIMVYNISVIKDDGVNWSFASHPQRKDLILSGNKRT